MAKICCHCIIKGKVQGVFYRHNTKQQADALQLTGWVRNLPDGSVEVLACGEDKDLDLLLKWLPRGPERAQVEHVDFNKQPYTEFPNFEIKG